jgi:hypothetical protein
MKSLLTLITLAYIGVHSASACTDPTEKKVLRHSHGDCIIQEYYHPASITTERQKKLQRPISVIADSILAAAKENFESNNSGTAQMKDASSIKMETDMKYYRYKADAITLRTRNWADSICSLFRRSSWMIESDDLPR